MIPASATPIGQAHGEDGPERHDEDHDGEGQAERLGLGLLELGEGAAAELDLEAVDLGEEVSASSVPIGAASAQSVPRDLEGGEGDLAGLRPSVACGSGGRRGWRGSSPPSVEVGGLERALLVVSQSNVSRSTSGLRDRLDGGEQLRHRVLDLGVVDALLGAEHDRAGDARRRSRRSPPRARRGRGALERRTREVLAEGAAHRARGRRRGRTAPTTHITITTTQRRRKHHDTKTSEHRDLRGVGSRRPRGRPPSTS